MFVTFPELLHVVNLFIRTLWLVITFERSTILLQLSLKVSLPLAAWLWTSCFFPSVGCIIQLELENHPPTQMPVFLLLDYRIGAIMGGAKSVNNWKNPILPHWFSSIGHISGGLEDKLSVNCTEASCKRSEEILRLLKTSSTKCIERQFNCNYQYFEPLLLNLCKILLVYM